MNFASQCWHCPIDNPFTPQISLVILLTVCYTKLTMLLYMYFEEFGIVSISNPFVFFLLILVTFLLALILLGEVKS